MKWVDEKVVKLICMYEEQTTLCNQADKSNQNGNEKRRNREEIKLLNQPSYSTHANKS